MTADTPVFTLSYDAGPDDLIEWARVDPRRKRARRRTVWAIVSSLVIVSAITVLLSRPSATGQDSPTWLLSLVVVFGWLRVVQLLRRVWRLSPAVAGRRTWRAGPVFHGPRQEEVSRAGILAHGPDQPDVFYPWSDLSAVEETARAFYLHHRTGDAGDAAVLPKRGLPDASQIPDLGEFLRQAVARPPPASGGQPPAGQDPAAATD